MRKKIYFLLFFLFVFVIGASYCETKITIKNLSKIQAKEDYNKRLKEFNFLITQKKIFLNSLAKFLSTAKPVIDGYLHDNRQEIITFVEPIYEHFYPNLVQEIHFFKPPAISFVNFTNLNKYDQNLSKIRKDILWISTSFKPSIHFYVCKHYPGLRATYPILHNKKLIGSVSLGINILEFKKLMLKLGVNDVSIYLKDDILKKYLEKDIYDTYKRWPIYEGYRINGNIFYIPIRSGYIIKNDYVYTEIPIKDFFHNTIGFVIVRDNIKPIITLIKKESNRKLIFLIISYLVILLIVFFLFEWLIRKMESINEIITYVKKHQFDKIPKEIKVKDELDVYKKSLIEVANEIKTYIHSLHKEVKEYSNKAYIDPLSKTFNRRFLEEKDKEFIEEYKISQIKYGIIMLDIDNFKQINDTYGHEAGDKVIAHLTDTIKKIIRRNDFLIRYGGEEFVIILHNADAATTYKVAEKIRKTIQNSKITIDGKEISFTLSMGISTIEENDKSIFDAIKRADEKLYIAKKTGKNKVVT